MIFPYYIKSNYKKYYLRGKILFSYWDSENSGTMTLRTWYETDSDVNWCTQYGTSSDDIY